MKQIPGENKLFYFTFCCSRDQCSIIQPASERASWSSYETPSWKSKIFTIIYLLFLNFVFHDYLDGNQFVILIPRRLQILSSNHLCNLLCLGNTNDLPARDSRAESIFFHGKEPSRIRKVIFMNYDFWKKLTILLNIK